VTNLSRWAWTTEWTNDSVALQDGVENRKLLAMTSLSPMYTKLFLW